MGSAGSVGPPRRLVALIGAITVIPLAVFLWLGGKLVTQDRAIEQQQAGDSLRAAADLVVVSLERAIAGSEQKLASGSDDWPAGAVTITFHANRVEVSPPGRLAFLPVAPAMPQVPVEPFRAAESLEFQRGTGVGDTPLSRAHRVLAPGGGRVRCSALRETQGDRSVRRGARHVREPGPEEEVAKLACPQPRRLEPLRVSRRARPASGAAHRGQTPSRRSGVRPLARRRSGLPDLRL